MDGLDTDEHFKKMKVVNFDMIKNKVSQEKLKQYRLIDHQEIMHYLLHIREEIFSSIDMHIKKSTVNEHFKNTNMTVGTGRGRFFKKIRDHMNKESWRFGFFHFILLRNIKKKKKMLDNTYGSIFLIFFSLKIKYGCAIRNIRICKVKSCVYGLRKRRSY